ncbi:hypothetical protein WR25_20905 [Diploscapter pachys]|uniref:Uncharacterized protein n=1 Tax=Diploscapter pachys TaxID=2018661 RepID=A0A2A2L079_9BILA|nr:hypothetical protein WR25_20905 [Diploscapter pachys]
MVYIGIDLGTTYSCVSVMENGKPKAIHHDNGKNIVPSVVAYGAEILVGNDALNSNTDLSNVLYDSKRLLGWEFLHNLPNAETRQLWTFNVATRDKCAGYVLNKGTPDERFLKPEEVSAEILKYLKIYAEKYLNQKVTGVVVTVPALFQESQKAATEKAIELAELELKGLLHEPNAAAIAYNANHQLGNSKLLVFDFGGGTLDVSILEMVGNNVDVMAVTGDIHLGGQDVDGRIMKYALTEFKKSSNYDIDKRLRLIKKLREKCREAKEFLSNNIEETNIFMEINDEVNLKVPLTKSQLNRLCSDLFTKAIQQVDSALNTAQMKKEDINFVILVGGSTRISRIRELLTAKFGSDKIKLDLNPDEIVSHGAAIFANAIEVSIYN